MSLIQEGEVAPVEHRNREGHGITNDIKEGQFIQSRVEGIQNRAKSMYHRVEGFNAYTKWTLGTFDRSTRWFAEPLLTKVSSIGSPVVKNLDNGLSKVYCTLDDKIVKPAYSIRDRTVSNAGDVQIRLVDSAWFKKVDEVMSHVPTVVPFSTFFSAAEGIFQESTPKSFEEFKSGLQERLSGWDEALLGPAKVFYSNAVERINQSSDAPSNIKHVLEQAWGHYVIDTSRSLYNLSVSYYAASLENAAFAGQTTKEFVDAIHDHLGSRWNENLAEPLRELYTKAREATLDDLRPLRENHDVEGVVGVSRNVAMRVQGLATKGWAGTLSTAQRSLDYVLPEDDLTEAETVVTSAVNTDAADTTTTRAAVSMQQKENHPVTSSVAVGTEPSLHSISACATSRIQKRASRAWAAAVDLSTKSMAPLAHSDVIKNAEAAIRRAQLTVKEYSTSMEPMVASFVSNLSEATDACVTAVNELKVMLNQKRVVLPQQLSDVRGCVTQLGSCIYSVVHKAGVRKLPSLGLSFVRQTLGYDVKSDDYNELANSIHKVVQATTTLLIVSRDTPICPVVEAAEETEMISPVDEVAAATEEGVGLVDVDQQVQEQEDDGEEDDDEEEEEEEEEEEPLLGSVEGVEPTLVNAVDERTSSNTTVQDSMAEKKTKRKKKKGKHNKK